VNVPVPRLVAWEVTRRCNLRCRHFRASAVSGAYDGELTLDEAKALVDDIASFAQPILILTGGEPLLCPWLWEIVPYARAKGLKPVLGTNATLIDDALAAKTAAAGIPRVSVSLDFPTAAAHDDFRGVKGAFESTLRGIGALRRAGVEVQVNVTVTKLNLGQLPFLHDLAVVLGVQALHPFLLVPTGRGADLAGAELSAAEYEEALRWVYETQKTSPLLLKPTDAPQYRRIVRQRCAAEGCAPPVGGHGMNAMSRGCLAGTGFCFVSHVGDVQPCGYFDLKLGNVRERPFSQIWRKSPVLDDLRHPERLKGKCGACEFKSVCGGCRARALAKTGDYLAEEPYCAHVPDRVLLDLLQTDFPLAERPYADLGRRLGLSEAACYARAKALREQGLIRRLGASFVPRRLGCLPLLVAAKVAEERLDEVAAAVNAFAQVTHNYVREGAYNLWFTVIARSAEEIDSILAQVAMLPGVERILRLPSEKTYKLRAVFPPGSGGSGGSPRQDEGGSVSDRRGEPPRPRVELAFVRRMQGDILDRGPAPFAAGELEQVKALVADGTIRRFGAIANHRAVGFAANALVVWTVPSDRLDAAGAALSDSPFVSHCYVRTPQDGWPYNLYAMAHAHSETELEGLVRNLSEVVWKASGAAAPLVLSTRREYKKSSMRFA